MQDSGLIQELPLSVPFFHNQVEAFLRESGLRMEEFDHYYACTSPDGAILAGAGIKADIIKCLLHLTCRIIIRCTFYNAFIKIIQFFTRISK